MVSNDYTRILVVKNRDEFIQDSINLPNISNMFVSCRTPYTISVLNGIVDKNVIDCLNAGDVTSAIQCINPQNRKTEDNIISLLIDRYTRLIKNINVRFDFTRHYEYDSENEKLLELERLTARRDELESKINAIKDRVNQGDMCCICYDSIENKTIVPCCSNSYCFKCLSMWLCRVNTCPICKASMNLANVLVVDQDKQDEASTSSVAEQPDHSNDIHSSNDKIKNLENILRKMQSGSKVLLFSSFENSFTHVLQVLQTMQLSYASLKGNSNQISKIVDQYKNGDLNVLLINSRCYGSGLNLENTSDIILFHKFDSEIEKQVIGRAHRYGRREPLKVWYLLYENEMGDVDRNAGVVLE
jgi:SNF2 family DNA or RNA helicase